MYCQQQKLKIQIQRFFINLIDLFLVIGGELAIINMNTN